MASRSGTVGVSWPAPPCPPDADDFFFFFPPAPAFVGVRIGGAGFGGGTSI